MKNDDSKIKVEIRLEGNFIVFADIEMSREEFMEIQNRLENAAGLEEERIAEELFDLAGCPVDSIELIDWEVAEFTELEENNG